MVRAGICGSYMAYDRQMLFYLLFAKNKTKNILGVYLHALGVYLRAVQ